MPIRLNDALKKDAEKKAAAEAETTKKVPVKATETKPVPTPIRKSVDVVANIPEEDDETRSKHVQLLMYPSLHERAVMAAKKRKLSLNKYIETLIINDLEL